MKTLNSSNNITPTELLVIKRLLTIKWQEYHDSKNNTACKKIERIIIKLDSLK